ncbi:hypothetical protein K493DRAFT_314474 [Basidiobolus meristosporus CBS 931.73]|uniref:Yeast cell wall synthesis Kre9/Knh1-like N-terminal domain-containing protein n=1 Tax=Basidiobolus meristosporus CBS 931.73 TaxID=1314790 RepID=A0A1Y1YF38_9FUNG|nr:hypothetical protein K493DRAFT_314474 [Basidiobolus meristosporus CBS 931.73]|eukprot:ORX96533.1 hypothetical protein K493DRAFT_314474 [Basidiobolus meristosporus CBS 931.73]
MASALTYVHSKAVITAPMQNSWKAGTKNIITWQDNSDGTPMPAKHDIALMQGKSTSLALVATISNNVDTSSGQYQWDIPATQAPAKDYAIRIGSAPNYSYSPSFEILASDGNANNNTNNSGSQPSDNNHKNDASSIVTASKLSTGALIGYIALQLL